MPPWGLVQAPNVRALYSLWDTDWIPLSIRIFIMCTNFGFQSVSYTSLILWGSNSITVNRRSIRNSIKHIQNWIYLVWLNFFSILEYLKHHGMNCLIIKSQTIKNPCKSSLASLVHSWFQFLLILLHYCGPCSLVGTATELRVGRSGIESRWGRDFPPFQSISSCVPDGHLHWLT